MQGARKASSLRRHPNTLKALRTGKHVDEPDRSSLRSCHRREARGLPVQLGQEALDRPDLTFFKERLTALATHPSWHGIQ